MEGLTDSASFFPSVHLAIFSSPLSLLLSSSHSHSIPFFLAARPHPRLWGALLLPSSLPGIFFPPALHLLLLPLLCKDSTDYYRHGARLDAADKNWHLTSPTPYDPPLSYGGWMQSRALGARIISMVNSPHDQDHSPRSESSSANATPDTSARSSPQPQPVQSPKRKRRIIIHTSPYLRCLQTAIAVSSGISQYDPSPESNVSSDVNNHNANATASSPSGDAHRSPVRVDAFLGEWLCPDYFDDITPPPNSERLVAAAKAELLRRSVAAVPQADMSMSSPTGNFPGGWGSSSSPGSPGVDGETRPGPTPLAGQRYRAGSYDTLNPVNNHRSKGLLSKINTNLSSIPDALNPGGYVPPTPSYAIAPSDPIPAGYVTHARNACAKVDYQWDSMQNPQDWGHGGEYGEELSAMHLRFRNGLESMVEWYQDHDTPPARQQSNNGSEHENDDGEEDEEVDTVLILITHGAGCNAMVGALTGEPVLLDFNTASLTMAVRKDDAQQAAPYVDGPDDPSKRLRRSSSNVSRLQDYDLTLAASVDHLRPWANPLQNGPGVLPSPTSSPSPSISSYRHNRMTSRPSLSQGQFVMGPSSTPGVTSQPWVNARPSTAPRAKSGLWGSPSTEEEVASDSADEIVPNFGGPASSSATPSTREGSKDPQSEEQLSSSGDRSIPQRTMSQRGLWGSAPLNKDREAGVKRRWTVTERRV